MLTFYFHILLAYFPKKVAPAGFIADEWLARQWRAGATLYES